MSVKTIKCETWDQLFALKDQMTPEALKEPIRFWGDEKGGKMPLCIDILEEPFYSDGEYLLSETDKNNGSYDEVMDEIVLKHPAGTPIIDLDDTINPTGWSLSL